MFGELRDTNVGLNDPRFSETVFRDLDSPVWWTLSNFFRAWDRCHNQAAVAAEFKGPLHAVSDRSRPSLHLANGGTTLRQVAVFYLALLQMLFPALAPVRAEHHCIVASPPPLFLVPEAVKLLLHRCRRGGSPQRRLDASSAGGCQPPPNALYSDTSAVAARVWTRASESSAAYRLRRESSSSSRDTAPAR